MFRFFSLLLIGVLVREGYTTSASISRPCGPDDSECYIIANTRNALSRNGEGLPEYGIDSIEPMVFKNLTLARGLFNLHFPYMKVVGSKECKVEDMKLNFAQSTMSITSTCPMKITGKYKFTGSVYFFEASHVGNFKITTDNISTTMDFKINTVRGADDKRYWKLEVLEYVYEPQQTLRITLENLFTSEITKDSPFFTPGTGDWWPTVAKTAEPVVSAIVGGFHGYLDAFYQNVPLEQLSTQILPRPTFKPLVPSIANLECFSFSSVADVL